MSRAVARSVIVTLVGVGVLIWLFNSDLIRVRSPFKPQAGYVGTATPKNRFCVAFVHGILGSADTWVNGTATFPYSSPRTEFSSEVDVFAYESYTPEFGSAPSIPELADQLDEKLQSHKVFASHEHVVFVGHSMGGLVVRQLLLADRALLAKVPVLYFAAVPTGGAHIAETGRQLSTNPQLRGMAQLDNNDFLQSMRSQWGKWPEAMKTPTLCAFETLDTFGVRVVSELSATSLCSQFEPITANHIDIAKPSQRDDPRYSRFATALRTALHELGLQSARSSTLTDVREPKPDDLTGDATPAPSGSTIELSTAFVDYYADRLTIRTHMTIDRAGHVHSPQDDSDLKFVGAADETLLPTVGEVMNARGQPQLNHVLKAAIDGKQPINVAGVWRLWFEHPEPSGQVQGTSHTEPGSSNPPHFLELHPVTSIGDLDLSDTVTNIAGFEPHETSRALPEIQRRRLTIARSAPGRVRLTMKPIGFNYIDVLVKVEQPALTLKDGHAVQASLFGTDGHLVASNIRVLSADNTGVNGLLEKARPGNRLRLLAIARVSLRQIQTLPDGEHVLPYELVAVGVIPQ